MFWDWIQFLLSMPQSFKWVRACADVHTLKVIESITTVMFTAGRVEEEEMEERKQCLRQCYRLFQSKVDMFYFKKPPGLLHVSGDFLPGPICSVQPNAASVKNRLMAYSPDTWAASGTYMKHAVRAKAQTQRRTPPVAEQSQRRSHFWWNLEENLCNKLM